MTDPRAARRILAGPRGCRIEDSRFGEDLTYLHQTLDGGRN